MYDVFGYNPSTHVVNSGLSYGLSTVPSFATLSSLEVKCYKSSHSNIFFLIYCTDNVIYFLYKYDYLTANSSKDIGFPMHGFCSSELTKNNYITFFYNSGTSQNNICFITATITPSVSVVFSDLYISFSSAIKAVQLSCLSLSETKLLIFYKNENEVNSPTYARIIRNIDPINKTFEILDPISIIFSDSAHLYSKIYSTKVNDTDIVLVDGSSALLGIIKYNSINDNIQFYEKTNYTNNIPISNTPSKKIASNIGMCALSPIKCFIAYTDSEYSDKVMCKFLNLY